MISLNQTRYGSGVSPSLNRQGRERRCLSYQCSRAWAGGVITEAVMTKELHSGKAEALARQAAPPRKPAARR
ncbi:MAG: hypothetical protein ABF570_04900, partial [Acetobacter syzygii]